MFTQIQMCMDIWIIWGQWNAGKVLTTCLGREGSICSYGPFQCCKHSCHGWFMLLTRLWWMQSWKKRHIIGWHNEIWHFTVRKGFQRICPLDTRGVWHNGSHPLSKMMTEIFSVIKWIQLLKTHTEEKVED